MQYSTLLKKHILNLLRTVFYLHITESKESNILYLSSPQRLLPQLTAKQKCMWKLQQHPNKVIFIYFCIAQQYMEYMQHERSNVPGNAERKYLFFYYQHSQESPNKWLQLVCCYSEVKPLHLDLHVLISFVWFCIDLPQPSQLKSISHLIIGVLLLDDTRLHQQLVSDIWHTAEH